MIDYHKIWVRHGSRPSPEPMWMLCRFRRVPYIRFGPDASVTRWIHWLTKTGLSGSIVTICHAVQSGKNRIKPELFLTIRIPLPRSSSSGDVARIEELAAKIADARRLRQDTTDEVRTLLRNGAKQVMESVQAPSRPSAKWCRCAEGHAIQGQPVLTGRSNSVGFAERHEMPGNPRRNRSYLATAIEDSSAKLIEPGAVLVVVRGMILVHTVPSAILRVPAA